MKQRLALFDFDDTMYKGNSIVVFIFEMVKKGFLPSLGMLRLLWNTLRWKQGSITTEEVKSFSLHPLLKLTPGARQDFCRQFTQSKLVPYLYADAVAAMERHALHGDLVLLVSASPEIYLQYLSEVLPVNGVLGTQTDEEMTIRQNLVLEEKVRRIRQWLNQRGIDVDWSGSSAYGDSANDLPMLRMVGQPFLINPRHKIRALDIDIPVQRWQ